MVNYPVTMTIAPQSEPRNRLTTCVLLLGWLITTVIAWFAILFTRSYPRSLHTFGIGVMRWGLRVEAYLLLLVDDYPPFTLD